MTLPVSSLIELAAENSVTLAVAVLVASFFIAAVVTGAAGRITLFLEERG